MPIAVRDRPRPAAPVIEAATRLAAMNDSSAAASPVPILGGTGALGYGLALRWASAGVPVVIGSRDAARAEEAAGRVEAEVPDAQVEGLGNEEAAARGPIVFLTVPFRAQSETLNNLRGALQPGQILVDCTVPLAAAVSGKATRSLGVWQGSAAQQAQEMVPDGVTVVSALHTVGAPQLANLDQPLGEDVLICGDKKADKAPVAHLIERIDGLRAINAGPLEMARIAEQLTPLLISVNVRYKAHAGFRLTDLDAAGHWD